MLEPYLVADAAMDCGPVYAVRTTVVALPLAAIALPLGAKHGRSGQPALRLVEQGQVVEALGDVRGADWLPMPSTSRLAPPTAYAEAAGPAKQALTLRGPALAEPLFKRCRSYRGGLWSSPARKEG